MPARHIGVGPTARRGPLTEHENEDVFAWLRRQANPVKPRLPRTVARKTTFEAAIAEMVERKKGDAAATGHPPIPEGINT